MEWHQHEERMVVADPRDRLRITLHDQYIPGAKLHPGELFVQPTALAPHPNHDGSIATPKIDVADRSAHEIGLWRDDRLHNLLLEILHMPVPVDGLSVPFDGS